MKRIYVKDLRVGDRVLQKVMDSRLKTVERIVRYRFGDKDLPKGRCPGFWIYLEGGAFLHCGYELTQLFTSGG